MQLSSTFTAYATATSAVKSPAPQPSNDAADALAHLKEPILWNLRDDGASPLVSRAYLLKDGVLIDPMEGDVPLYPPVKNSWLVKNKLDYTDMNLSLIHISARYRVHRQCLVITGSLDHPSNHPRSDLQKRGALNLRRFSERNIFLDF